LGVAARELSGLSLLRETIRFRSHAGTQPGGTQGGRHRRTDTTVFHRLLHRPIPWSFPRRGSDANPKSRWSI